MSDKRYKRNDNAKWVLTSIAFVLAFIMIAGIILQIFGTGKLKPSEWFKKDETEQSELETGGEESGGLSIPEEVAGNGISLLSSPIDEEDYENYGISPLSDTAYVITASVFPVDATNRNVVASVAFNNPSSTWANGKTVTNYVTATVIEQSTTIGSTSKIRVECFAPFGEKIVLTVASEQNSELKATCTCDYVRRVTGMNVTFFGNDVLNNGAASSVSLGTSNTDGRVATSTVSWAQDIVLQSYSVSAFFSSVYTVTEDITYSVKWKYSDAWFDVNSQECAAGRDYFLNASAGVKGEWNALGGTHSGVSQTPSFPFQFGRYLGVHDTTKINNQNVSASYLRTGTPAAITSRNTLKAHSGNITYIMEFLFTAQSEHMICERIVSVGLNASTLTVDAASVEVGQTNLKY